MTSTTQRPAAAATDHLASRAHETIDRVANSAAEAELRIREGAEAAASKVKESEERARQLASDSAEQVSGYIKQNPLLCAGIAFAAGVVLSSLLRR
jgi:ElaB/YqjD/DUF883 family membrane-anchored ribosome-binding protein